MLSYFILRGASAAEFSAKNARKTTSAAENNCCDVSND